MVVEAIGGARWRQSLHGIQSLQGIMWPRNSECLAAQKFYKRAGNCWIYKDDSVVKLQNAFNKIKRLI
jgi:hypothetical protein